jgi:anthranilate phosphoribosyltransferase
MLEQILHKLLSHKHLTRAEARAAFESIVVGDDKNDNDDDNIAEFLQLLATKGETIDEIVAAAETLRRHVVPVSCPTRDAIDTCGTGGDGVSTFNVSTTAAIIAAGAGAVVAKHGNRTNTRVSGSAEVLAHLGVNIEAEVPVVERALREVGLAFLYASRLHPAMRRAAAARRRLGIRTIFNIVGPLANPAGVRHQVVGVSRPELTETLAGALAELGAEHAMVVHGADGLCDLSVTGDNRVTECRDGKTHTYTVSASDVGLADAPLSDLLVSSPGESADAVRAILDGQPGPRRDQAVLNAAAALVVADKAHDLRAGVALAQHALDSGAARDKLEALICTTETK